MNEPYDFTQILGNNLRFLRKKNNLSQLELSVRTDLSHTFINNIENGKKWVSPETLSIFCQALNAYPFEFFLTENIPDQNAGFKAEQEHSKMMLELDEMLSRYRKEKE